MAELPKAGDKVPADKIHVSKTNVNYGLPFPADDRDRKLIDNVRASKKIVEPFKIRPEDENGHWEPGMDLALMVGYGTFQGRRRLLAGKEATFKEFMVGRDLLVEEVGDREAREASWMENWGELRKGMDAITRAEQLNQIITESPGGVRAFGRRWSIPPANISDWLTMLKLSPKMQDMVRRGLFGYTHALRFARLKLGAVLQDELAEVLEKEGKEAFWREVERRVAGVGKRGIPKNVFKICRVSWDTRSRSDMSDYEVVEKAAEAKGMKVPEYMKKFLVERIDEVKRDIPDFT